MVVLFDVDPEAAGPFGKGIGEGLAFSVDVGAFFAEVEEVVTGAFGKGGVGGRAPGSEEAVVADGFFGVGRRGGGFFGEVVVVEVELAAEETGGLGEFEGKAEGVQRVVVVVLAVDFFEVVLDVEGETGGGAGSQREGNLRAVAGGRGVFGGAGVGAVGVGVGEFAAGGCVAKGEGGAEVVGGEVGGLGVVAAGDANGAGEAGEELRFAQVEVFGVDGLEVGVAPVAVEGDEGVGGGGSARLNLEDGGKVGFFGVVAGDDGEEEGVGGNVDEE